MINGGIIGPKNSPTTSSASGFWSLFEQATAKKAGNWRSLVMGIPSGFNLAGSIGVSANEWDLSFNSSTLYAISKASNPGSSVVYRSEDNGANWSTKATVTGTGSSYGAAILATSATRVVVQQQGSFFLSTDSGATFSTILNTSGGQNNFYKISTDGTYGVCGGYDRNVTTSNNWDSASAMSRPLGISMSTLTLTNNGSNKFVHAGFGSSGSPTAFYLNASNAGAGSTTISTGVNTNVAVTNPATGLYAVMSAAEGAGSYNAVRFGTYPSTSTTSASITGLGSPTYVGCITPWGDILVGAGNGLWLVKTNGAAPTQITSLTGFAAAHSDGSGAIFAIRTNGEVYTYKP